MEEIDRVTLKSLKANSATQLQECFKQWESRWTKCISMRVCVCVFEYFEGDCVEEDDLSC